MITKEQGKDTHLMEDKILDYSETLIKVQHKNRDLHDQLLKRKYRSAVDNVNDMIIDLILLKNWLNHENNKQV
jgi:hypothetical protein